MDLNKGKVIIHYQRKNSDYDNWALWLWEFPQGKGKEYEFNGKEQNGVTGSFPLSNWSNFVLYNNLGLIIKSKGSWNQKDGNDKIIKFYKMTPDKKGNYHVYVKEADEELYANTQLDKISTFAYAKFTSYKEVEAKSNDLVSEFNIKRNGEIIAEKKLIEPSYIINYKLDKEISFDNEYIIEIKLTKNNSLIHKRIRFAELYKTHKFQKMYNYDGELGAIVSNDETLFKVWSPVSKRILLRIYKSGTPTYIKGKKGNDEIVLEKEMIKGEKGVFFIKIPRNLHGFYYTYVVTNDSYKNREVVDIYAKSTSVNGARGMIVDFSKIDDYGLSNINIHPYSSNQLVVYETHVADLTSSLTWTDNPNQRKYEKTFLGAALEGTFYKENGKVVKTGFDHIKELGVNAVQLLPIFDQANDETKMTYNWGYNPANYNTVEGGYSTNPFDGETRIKEFKYLVKKYHDNGINIIMDVVFNHVNGAIGSNFDVLMPGYYFRYTKDGFLANGSGCGNETASDMPMYRKFMIDSVLFWAKEYKIAGFRFDLMAIHDLKTMNELVSKLHEYNKNIVVYGEPWAAEAPLLPSEDQTGKYNLNKFKNFGFFDDSVRDSLIRAIKNINNAGWCINCFSESKEDQKCISESIKSKTTNDLSVNYCSCHDNRTLFDRICFNGINSEKEIKRIAMLANSIVLTTNGISFILAGEEFLRTKGGCDNSYCSSYKINELDYSLLIKNNDLYQNYIKLIAFKKSFSNFQKNKSEIDINRPNVISFEIKDEINHRLYKIMHVNGLITNNPIIVDLDGYNLYLDTINAHKDLSKSTALIPYETLIAYK